MHRDFNWRALLEPKFEALSQRDIRKLRKTALSDFASARNSSDAQPAQAMLDEAGTLKEMAFHAGQKMARSVREQCLSQHLRALSAEQNASACQVAADLFRAEQALLVRLQDQVVSGAMDAAQAECVATQVRQRTEQSIEQALRLINDRADLFRARFDSIPTTTA